MRLEAISARHTKINKIEKLKETRSYQEAWEALQRYAKEGYDAISKEDMSYFLKTFGIFDRPATPGKFMLRVRIPGGRLTSEQATRLGELSRDYGEDAMDLTTRMQVQLRYLKIEDLPTVLEGLEAVGITTWQTGVDNFRNIVTDPLDGLAFDNLIECAPLIEAMQSLWLKQPDYINVLPRKFNTAISGSLANRCNLFAHDICFALANKDGEYGFNLYLGGKVGAIAERADIFVTPDELMELYKAVIDTYIQYGFRDSRNRNRLHYLIKEAGMETYVEAVKESAGRDFDSAGETLVKTPRTEEADGRIRLKDGTWALHTVVPSGIFHGTAMIDAAENAQKNGSGTLNISTTQNLFLLGVPTEKIDAALSEAPYDRYRNVSTPYFNQLVACAGSDLCPFGVIPNKADAIEMAEKLGEKVPLPADASIRMHWSGCVKGCGVHELGDIGFVGCKVKVDGQSAYGVHIQLGGKSTASQEEAYTILKSIPLTQATDYVAQLASAYRDLRRKRESFERFESRVLRRYSKGALGFLLHWNVRIALPKGWEALAIRENREACEERNEIFLMGLEIYKALAGKNAYQGTHHYDPIEKTPAEALHRLNPLVNKELSDVVMKMIAPSEKRYEVFTEVLADLGIK
ncbi:ferredoxin--nitrite reductase [Nitratifractor sp.]|uniref:nitrite/sulfite reductase n=1 Tax=Nitratifractor sp. TaxID=2268144 RepID=UPI0025FE51A0|nr:ferredoxin--nitrite reductase [Nitratifractor sp.]